MTAGATIYALSSGAPPAALAIIRISGPDAGTALKALSGALPGPLFRRYAVEPVRRITAALKAAHPDIELHLIGQLQSNKAAEAVAFADAIHAVDRSSLVTALAKAMDAQGKRPTCFLQVNIGDEPQKGGCAVDALPALLTEARAADLPIAGLMCIPPAGVEAAPYFALLAKIARDHGLTGLSMGMSDDFETAVMIGATHVRIGSALFGDRPPVRTPTGFRKPK